MKAKSIILLVVSLLFAGVLYTIVRPKKEEENLSSAELSPSNNPVMGGCISPPSYMKRYIEGDDWWGGAHRGLKLIGYSKEQADEYVDECAGFFKAIDVEPVDNYVKYFETEIREWVENGGGRHWNVEKGSYRCK